MNDKNDSFIEIALKEMKSKRKPRTLAKIAKEVFEIKGINPKEIPGLIPQFEIDFMLSGFFICCGEDKSGIKLWDIKTRQPSSLLDKDGSYLEDLYSDDEDVIKNELSDEVDYTENLDREFDSNYEEDEEEDEEEQDEIEEELISEGYYDIDEENNDDEEEN